MKIKRFAAILGMVAVGVLGVLPAGAAQPAVLTVTPSVVSQVCLNPDTVQVTLTATASAPSRFRWDFTNDGRFDTGVLVDPTVATTYGDELTITARVGARDQAGERAQNTVTFATIRCQ